MLTDDPSYGLLRSGVEIDRPSGEREIRARQLERKGVIRLQQETFARCVNPLDRDQKHLKDRHCDGRIYIEQTLNEDDCDYRCPRCSRLVYPSSKQRFTCLRIETVGDAIVRYIEDQIRAAGFDPVESPVGLYRVSGPNGMAEVCVVDTCEQAAVFMNGYTTPVVFVVINDKRLNRIEGRQNIFRLVDMLLGDSATTFQRRLRELVRADGRPSGVAAVLTPQAGMGLRNSTTVSPQASAPLAHPGTRWSDVEFFYIDGDTIAYRLPGQNAKRLMFSDVPDMADKRRSRHNKQWEILTKLCAGRGHLEWEEPRSAFKERVSQLRKSLQRLFGINDNPLRLSASTGLSGAFNAFEYLPSERPYEDSPAFQRHF